MHLKSNFKYLNMENIYVFPIQDFEVKLAQMSVFYFVIESQQYSLRWMGIIFTTLLSLLGVMATSLPVGGKE